MKEQKVIAFEITDAEQLAAASTTLNAAGNDGYVVASHSIAPTSDGVKVFVSLVLEREAPAVEEVVKGLEPVTHCFTDQDADNMTLAVSERPYGGIRVALSGIHGDGRNVIAYVTPEQLQEMIDVLQPFASDKVVVEEQSKSELAFVDTTGDRMRISVARRNDGDTWLALHNRSDNTITSAYIEPARFREVVELLQGHLK